MQLFIHALHHEVIAWMSHCSHVENFWGIVSPNDLQVQNTVSPMDILSVPKHKNN